MIRGRSTGFEITTGRVQVCVAICSRHEGCISFSVSTWELPCLPTVVTGEGSLGRDLNWKPSADIPPILVGIDGGGIGGAVLATG